jgi:hypothetical protein
MRRTWPIIGVKDVGASSAWYLSLLGQSPREAGHDDFDQIRDDDGTILICLHEWGAHGEGPPLQDPAPVAGNGVLFSILVEDFDECLARAASLGTPYGIDTEQRDGEWRSFWIRDPDDYYLNILAMEDIRKLETRGGGAGGG